MQSLNRSCSGNAAQEEEEEEEEEAYDESHFGFAPAGRANERRQLRTMMSQWPPLMKSRRPRRRPLDPVGRAVPIERAAARSSNQNGRRADANSAKKK